jgi:hypothetical protein
MLDTKENEERVRKEVMKLERPPTPFALFSML